MNIIDKTLQKIETELNTNPKMRCPKDPDAFDEWMEQMFDYIMDTLEGEDIPLGLDINMSQYKENCSAWDFPIPDCGIYVVVGVGEGNVWHTETYQA